MQEENQKDFEAIYKKVAAIVNKTRQNYYIKLWDYDDWHQEGRIILYRLLRDFPEFRRDDPKLFTYFKTKFINHANDVVRAQESQKRRFSKMAYEEIGEMGDSICQDSLFLDELVAFEDALSRFESTLNHKEKVQYRQFLRGERFRGQKVMKSQLQSYLSDFKN